VGRSPFLFDWADTLSFGSPPFSEFIDLSDTVGVHMHTNGFQRLLQAFAD